MEILHLEELRDTKVSSANAVWVLSLVIDNILYVASDTKSLPLYYILKQSDN